MRRSLLFVLLAALAAGCDSLPDSGATGEVVVESFLVVGEPLPAVTLRRSVSFGERANAGIIGAQVHVELLREDGGVDASIPFADAGFGHYEPAANTLCGQGPSIETAPCVLPLRRYRLVAEVPGVGTVTSTTRTPGDFHLLNASADTLVYQGPERLTFRVSRSTYPGRNAVFLFTTESLLNPPTIRDAVPFVRSFLDRDGDGQIDPDNSDFTLDDLRIGSSPLLNEANYDVNLDGSLFIRLPWIAVAFLGPNRIAVNAVDNNLNDFLRSADVQQGGSTSSPGEILNILDHVENGTGVFGSYARVSSDVFIRE